MFFHLGLRMSELGGPLGGEQDLKLHGRWEKMWEQEACREMDNGGGNPMDYEVAG